MGGLEKILWMVHRLAVDIFKGPVKPEKRSRTGMNEAEATEKRKAEEKKEESGRGGAKNHSEG